MTLSLSTEPPFPNILDIYISLSINHSDNECHQSCFLISFFSLAFSLGLDLSLFSYHLLSRSFLITGFCFFGDDLLVFLEELDLFGGDIVVDGQTG